MHETFSTGVNEDDAVLELGVEYMQHITSWLLFRHSTTMYPTFEEPTRDYRVTSETSGTIPIGNNGHWNLKMGMRNEYDPMPQPGVESLDTFYFVNMVWDVVK